MATSSSPAMSRISTQVARACGTRGLRPASCRMTWLWIPITIAAALLQNIRTALQKHLKGRLSTNGATYTRYVFGFPLAILYVAGLHAGAGLALPDFNA